MNEPLTSLLIREAVIAASAAGKLSRALWQVARVLREHLQPEINNARLATNKGESGDEELLEAASLPGQARPDDPFQADLWRSHD